MISFKVTGIDALVKKLESFGHNLPSKELDSAVSQASQIVVSELKANYQVHSKTGALVDSIQSFQRKRKGKSDPFYTAYIGPRYGGGKSLFSYGGNAAHLLEYGTVERYRANKAQGGFNAGKGRLYGAKISTGRVAPLGIIRRTYDEVFERVKSDMANRVESVLLNDIKKKGLDK